MGLCVGRASHGDQHKQGSGTRPRLWLVVHSSPCQPEQGLCDLRTQPRPQPMDDSFPNGQKPTAPSASWTVGRTAGAFTQRALPPPDTGEGSVRAHSVRAQGESSQAWCWGAERAHASQDTTELTAGAL